jgi:hypothetical protein
MGDPRKAGQKKEDHNILANQDSCDTQSIIKIALS